MRNLLCMVGFHGPKALGDEPTRRSDRSAPMERTCRVCGAVWEGEMVYGRTVRYLGGWRRVNNNEENKHDR